VPDGGAQAREQLRRLMYEYRELRSEQERRRRARHAARVASRPRKAAERVKLDMARLRQG